jgi:pyridinium-3,5-bisthiocarboxylic acid mononucleotide nickel chelatase
MAVAYFDCFSGISGDMILGAFVDLGFPVSVLNNALESFHLGHYTIETRKEKPHHLMGTRFLVNVSASHDQSRNHKAIRSLLEGSTLADAVKKRSIAIFDRLAKAEALIHNEEAEKIHFHEIGGVDSIVDIVGSMLAADYFGIDQIACSPLPLGSGSVTCHHGILPVPAPATVAILKGVPVYGSNIPGELVTPTGAAIIMILAGKFGQLPFLRIKKIGYGVGEKDRAEMPNMLRIILGEKEAPLLQEKVEVIETNIDDMSPAIYEYFFDVLFERGALDVLVIPVHMKKNRPAILLKVLTLEKDKSTILRTLFEETSTLGIRCYTVERFALNRRIEEIETPLGAVRMKIAVNVNGEEEWLPEYEDCRRIAQERHIALKKVYREVLGYKENVQNHE